MTTPKKAIAEILATFKNSDDTLWTEDGSPALEAVQKLAEDNTITRAQIDEAIPGFVRIKPGDLAKNTTIAPPVEAKTTRVAPEDIDREYSDDEMRTILDRRVRDAETNLLAAQKAVTEANAEVNRCQVRLQRAHADHGRQFPPITAAANIKAHLAAQIELARERAGLGKENRAQVDVSMERSNRRGQGQGRPTRPVNNVNVSTAA